jgi:hypothetical protein
MDEEDFSGKVHPLVTIGPSEWVGAAVKFDKPVEFNHLDEHFLEKLDQLIDVYFEHLREKMRGFVTSEDVCITYRPPMLILNELGAPHGVIAIKFKR